MKRDISFEISLFYFPILYKVYGATVGVTPQAFHEL